MIDVDYMALSIILAQAAVFCVIAYIISVFFARIMFRLLGVKENLSFIPIYNTYRIYKEYKGRVWKKNWGILSIIMYLLAVVIVLCSLALPLNPTMPLKILGPLFSVIGICSILATIFNVILSVVLYLPIFETTFSKVMLVINIVATIFAAVHPYVMGNTIPDVSDYLIFEIGMGIVALILSIIFLVTYFVAAITIRDKVKRGEYILQEKLDYNLYNKDEIKSILKERGRKIAVPVKREENSTVDMTFQNSEEYI